jgi:hypothetical protein
MTSFTGSMDDLFKNAAKLAEITEYLKEKL